MSHLAALSGLLGPEVSLISDPDVTASYSRDQAPFAKSASPFAVLLARSAAEISIALKYANENKIPVVTRGAGSGLSGGANSDAQSLVISLEKMNQIIEIDGPVTGVVYIGRHGCGAVGRPNGSSHKTRFAGILFGKCIRNFSSYFGAFITQLVSQGFQLIIGQRNALRTEGIGFNNIGTGS